MSTDSLILNLDKARQIVLREVRSEQVTTILAVTVSLFVITILLACVLAGLLFHGAEGFTHSVRQLPHGLAVGMMIVGIIILSAGLLGCFVLVGTILYDSALPYDSRFPLLHETARWLLLLICAPFGVVLPPLILGPWILLQSRFAYQGRFKLACALDVVGNYVIRLSPTYYQNIVAAHRSEIHFHAGNYKLGLEMAAKALAAALAAYDKDTSENNLLSLIVVGSSYAALLGMRGLHNEGEPLMESLISKRDDIDRLPVQRQAEAFSYLAYGCVHLGQAERALVFSELAAASYENSKRNIPPLAGCIAEHWALAALDKGMLDRAEEQALSMQKHWTAVTSKTGERQADSYYVLGQVALAKGQKEFASEQLALAIAIRQIRNGKHHPELLKYESHC